MRDMILDNLDKSYIVHYGLDKTSSTSIESYCSEAISEIRTHFVESMHQALKGLDVKNLTMKQHEKIKLAITIQPEKIELTYLN